MAQRAKYEGKVEKQEKRIKLYDISVTFEDSKKRKDAVVWATSREDAVGATSKEVANQLQLMH